MTDPSGRPAGREISCVRYSAAQARAMTGMVEAIYTSSYTEAIASGHSFDSVDAFMVRFDAYSANPDLDMVIAYSEDQPVGQAWGWPLTAKSRWWSGIVSAPDDEFTVEDGARTFALSEIMVAQSFTGQGIARHLHDFLLSARREKRATLLVESDNSRARRAYLRWGWREVAQLKPDWPDSPLYDVMTRPLTRLVNEEG